MGIPFRIEVEYDKSDPPKRVTLRQGIWRKRPPIGEQEDGKRKIGRDQYAYEKSVHKRLAHVSVDGVDVTNVFKDANEETGEVSCFVMDESKEWSLGIPPLLIGPDRKPVMEVRRGKVEITFTPAGE